MPKSEYFGGHGEEVMADMKKRYGKKKGKSAFYATANARNQTPGPDYEESADQELDNPENAKYGMGFVGSGGRRKLKSNAPKGAPVKPDMDWMGLEEWRQLESVKVGGFKDGAMVKCPFKHSMGEY